MSAVGTKTLAGLFVRTTSWSAYQGRITEPSHRAAGDKDAETVA